jgi:hypothetical protein
MRTDLTTNAPFDEYAARFGWHYDNGGNYRGEYWEWYMRSSDHIVLLRQAPDRVCVVRFSGLTPFELWSGTIRTSDDFDRMTAEWRQKIETDETRVA